MPVAAKSASTESPTFHPCDCGRGLGDDHVLVAEIGQRSVHQVQAHQLVCVARVDRRVARVGPVEAGLTPPGGRDLVDPRDVGDGIDDRRTEARALGAGWREEQVGAGLVPDHLTEGVLERRREDTHAHHQREPDHQRRSRGGGTPGVAHRVLPRQLSRESAKPHRSGDQGGQRTHGQWHRHDHAGQHADQADTQEQHRRVAVHVGEHAARSRCQQGQPDDGAPLRHLLGVWGRVAQRFDGEHLGGPPRRDESGRDRHQGADEHRDHDGAGLELERGAGQAEAGCVHQEIETLRHGDTEADPDRRGEAHRSASPPRAGCAGPDAGWRRSPASARSLGSAG